MRKAQSESLKIDTYGAEPGFRRCDAPGCTAAGEHRAPKGRSAMAGYYWFCLEHVREYNERWNYYEGASAEELEEEIRRSTTWDRPTWPLGTAAAYRAFVADQVRDPLGALNGDDEMDAASGSAPRRPGSETEEEKLSPSWAWLRRSPSWN